jgi:hypothetical protein
MRDGTPEAQEAIRRLHTAQMEFNAAVGDAYRVGLRIEIEAHEEEFLYLRHTDAYDQERILSSHPEVRVIAVEVVCGRSHS